MTEATKIEWADSTFNPWEGCTKVGPGCDHCYAEARNSRFGGGHAINWGPGAPRRRTSAENWKDPVRWNAAHASFFAEHGRRRRVFSASLADVFDNEVDPAWRADLFTLIEQTPNLDWLLLTKRVGNVAAMIAATRGPGWLETHQNVWIGATFVNQPELDRDLAKLLLLPARIRFASFEPLLSAILIPTVFLKPLDWGEGLRSWPDRCGTLDWVIAGGESGPGARPSHPDWYRSLRDQCAAAGVPFLFKQWGEYMPADADDCDPGVSRSHLAWSDGTPYAEGDGQRGGVELMARVGKRLAGRKLDGLTHDGFPEMGCR